MRIAGLLVAVVAAFAPLRVRATTHAG